MNVTLTLNDSDISNYVISYERTQQICTGMGTIDLALSGNYPDDINTWNVIKVFEDGTLDGTYNIASISYDKPAYLINISAQDDSKRLVDYFITDDYTVEDGSLNSYWLDKFLTESGVSYIFNPECTFVQLSNYAYLGKTQAYEQIVQLLQMSGLFMYFDEDNTCIIGKITTDISETSNSFTESDMISIKTTRNDKLYRNRAVVWGAADPTGKEWVFADISKPTPWNYGYVDSRTAVISSISIPTTADAYSMAYKMLDEWAHLTFIKEITLYGVRDVSLGDGVYIESPLFTGSGVITTLSSTLSSQGLTTTITLDEKCPRLFGMWSDLNNKVYVGTWGSGVKRKSIKGTTWSDYSSGLPDLYINDLYVNNGLLTCVTKTGMAFLNKEIHGYWTEINIPALSGISYPQLRARAVTQDKFTNNIRLIVDTYNSDNTAGYEIASYSDVVMSAWLLDINPITGGLLTSYPITLSGESNYSGFDIENDGKFDYVTVIYIPISGVQA
jgi:hypothetical protein